MENKKLNFKQKKYILPLIALPFILFFGYQAGQFINPSTQAPPPTQELSLSLGDTQDSILAKDDAYDALFANEGTRTLLDGLEKENDSLRTYEDNLDVKQKRHIDSLRAIRNNPTQFSKSFDKSFYEPSSTPEDRDYQRSLELIKMLNEKGNSNTTSSQPTTNLNQQATKQNEEIDDPVKTLRKQMLIMDSLEKARDPEHQSKLAAELKLKKDKEKYDAFLNSTLRVHKAHTNPSFNTVYRDGDTFYVKAVIDESVKGTLGSRIRFRLLEDVFIGKYKVNKGTFLYGQISGFSLQRVNLNIVSILNHGEILPINLSVYDIDGIKGLYVPMSDFREMMREMGSNSIQGTSLDMGSQSFYQSILSSAFSSASRTISNLIKRNKAKLKYNTYIYLINEEELKQKSK